MVSYVNKINAVLYHDIATVSTYCDMYHKSLVTKWVYIATKFHVTPEAWGLRVGKPWVNMIQLTCAMAPPLVSTKPEILQFTNPTVFIGKLVRIDCEF